MKRILFLCAMALLMTACGQQDDKTQEQNEAKQVIIPPGIPVAPMPSNNDTPIELGTMQNDPQAPVLQIEEGKPLDLSQLMGQRKTLEEQVTSNIDTIRIQAEQGKADYQYLYGASFEYGWGVDQDSKQAYAWYKKAADQQQPASYNAIGNLYRMGSGVPQDAKEALRWYQLGADAGDAQAMLNVGNCYYFGMAVEKDLAKAVGWWQQSADNGNGYAMAQMGDCYYAGLGVQRDLDKAIEYLSQAANKNISSAQFRLGLMYYNGEGVQQDRTYSKLLMQKASDGGLREAQDFLNKNF